MGKNKSVLTTLLFSGAVNRINYRHSVAQKLCLFVAVLSLHCRVVWLSILNKSLKCQWSKVRYFVLWLFEDSCVKLWDIIVFCAVVMCL